MQHITQITNWYFQFVCCQSYNEGPGNEATVMNGVLVLAEVGGEGLEQCPYTLLIMIIQLHKVTPACIICFWSAAHGKVGLQLFQYCILPS